MITLEYDSNALHFKKDDIPSPLTITVKNRDSQTNIDFSGSTAVFVMTKVLDSGGISEVINDSTSISGEEISYIWQAGDLNESGKFYVKFIVTGADATVISYPQKSYIEVEVESLE